MALEMKYFVLKPRSKYFGDSYAEASRMAMTAYAVFIKKHDPELAKDLENWVRREQELSSRMNF